MQDHKDYLKTTVRVKNPNTGQTDSFTVRFDPKGTGSGNEETWFKRNLKWTDYVIGFLMVVLVVLLLANNRVDNDRKMI